MRTAPRPLQAICCGVLLDELQYEPTVDPAEIGITTNDRIVTLSGKVKSLAEKWSAVRATERVGGVKAVVDEINVELPFHINEPTKILPVQC